MNLCKVATTVLHKIFAIDKFYKWLPKRGAEIFTTKILAKAVLIHCIITVTWLLCLCGLSRISMVGSLTVFSVLYAVVCLFCLLPRSLLVHFSWGKVITTANDHRTVSIFKCVDRSMVLHCIMCKYRPIVM